MTVPCPSLQHEARVQKAAEAKRAGAAAVPAADQGGSGGAAQPAQPPKDAPLLYDLVFEGEPELCIKVHQGEAVWLLRGLAVGWEGPR